MGMKHCIYMAVACLLIGACSRSDNAQVTLWQEPKSVQMNPLYSYGTESGPVEQLLYGWISFELDAEGWIWILHRDEFNLHLLNPSGELVKIYSRKGEGPGEFMNPYTLGVSAADAQTWDAENTQLCRWSKTDGLLEVTSLDLGTSTRRPRVIEADGTLWSISLDHTTEIDGQIYGCIYYADQAGESVSLLEIPIPVNRTSDGMAGAFGREPRMVRCPWGGILVTLNHTYSLVHQTRNEQEQWTFPSLGILYSPDEIQKNANTPVARTQSETVYRPLPPHKYDIQAIFPVSPDEIWIKTSIVRDDGYSRADRIGRSGSYLGSYWIPSGWVDVRVLNNRWYALERTSEGTQFLTCYSIKAN